MIRATSLSRVPIRASRSLVAIVCAALLAPGEALFLAQATPPAAAQATAEEPKLPPEQLDALVAPVALYPDPLLGQVLVASTYPLEIVQLQQWLAKNPGLKDKALADAPEGLGNRRTQDERAAEGRDEGRRAEDGDRR